MKATIANYRGSHHTQKSYQFVVYADGVSSKDAAAKLIGKKVVWHSPKGTKEVGKITNVHGNNGALRARFANGLPGQSVGTHAEII